MKLLLTSNGLSSPPLEQAFTDMVGDRMGLRVALIQTAGDPIEWIQDKSDSKKFTARLIKQNNLEDSEAYKNYTEKGYEVVDADLKQDPHILKDKLQNVDIIDVPGGDINYLLDWANKSKIGSYLIDILEKGVIYLGASAGSVLLGPDIGLTWWKPEDYEDHFGLRITDFIVVPHQKESDERSNEKNLIERKYYMQSVMDFPWKIYLLQDGQAVKVDGDKIEHIGPGIKKSI
jgi:dipeptidase E